MSLTEESVGFQPLDIMNAVLTRLKQNVDQPNISKENFKRLEYYVAKNYTVIR